jgi:hypothetical protein
MTWGRRPVCDLRHNTPHESRSQACRIPSRIDAPAWVIDITYVAAKRIEYRSG